MSVRADLIPPRVWSRLIVTEHRSLAKALICFVWLCLLPAGVLADRAETPELTFCYEDRDSYPWVLTDGSGLNLELLGLVEQALALRFSHVPVPWRRCLAGLEQGAYDGAFAASFKAERLSLGRYPLDGAGRPDPSKRLHTSSYALYRRKGSAVSWDGRQFQRLSGRVGSLSGFSIVDFLHGHGVVVDETSRDPLALLQMLEHGRIEAAALQGLRADFVLQANPQLTVRIEKLEVPLEEKAYYLMLSNALVASDPALAAAIWSEIAHWRESAAYRERVQAFLASPVE